MQIERTDGTSIAGLTVVVAPDSVRFVTESGRQAVATDEVQLITYERDRFSPGEGAGGGALFGIGLATLATSGSGNSGFIPESAIIGIIVVGSTLFGLILGVAEQVGPQARVAYQGPVTRYDPTGIGEPR